MANNFKDWQSKKRCTKCYKAKPRTTEFYHLKPRSADGLNYRCKTCVLEDDRLRRYGVNVDYYDEVTHCQICYTEFGDSQSLSGKCIDHDHNNGEARGVICSACNKTLGYAKDSTERLANCIAYLERYRSE